MILDSSFLIDLLRGRNEEAKKKAEELDRIFVTKSISSISIMELWRGACLIQSEKEKKKILSLLNSVIIYDFDAYAAKVAAEIEADLKIKGKNIDREDIMIAAIAKTKNEPVLTRNVKHFSKIEGLTVESY